MEFFSDVGLIFNIIGTLLIAFAFGILKDDTFLNTDSQGKKKMFSYLHHPMGFKVGVILIIIGFLLQLNLGRYLFNYLLF